MTFNQNGQPTRWVPSSLHPRNQRTAHVRNAGVGQSARRPRAARSGRSDVNQQPTPNVRNVAVASALETSRTVRARRRENQQIQRENTQNIAQPVVQQAGATPRIVRAYRRTVVPSNANYCKGNPNVWNT